MRTIIRCGGIAFLACCVTALASGCQSYPPARLSAAQSAAALDTRSLADPRLQAFIAAALGPAAPAPRWGLARLTLAALYYHPDLAIARARLGEAQAAVLTAEERPNPRLDFAAVFGTNAVAGAIPPGAAPLVIGPVIDFLVETAGKREYRTARARRLAEAARAGIAVASWQVRQRVRGALLDLWAARRRLALVRRRLGLQEQLVRLLQDRLAVGAASALDVERERIRRAQLALAVRNSERAAADARARLASAIGVPLAALDGVALSFAAFDQPPAPPAGFSAGALRRRALTRRADVRAALARYAAAQSAVRLAIAGQYPNVTLGPGYKYDLGTNKYLLSPSVVLPIFNQNQGAIAEAVAARRQVAAQFTALQAGTIAAIDRAAADWRTTGAALATAQSLAADARRRVRQVQRSFAAGAIGRPALLAAELELAAIELSRFSALANRRRALGAIEDALQYPLFAPAPMRQPEISPRRNAEPGT